MAECKRGGSQQDYVKTYGVLGTYVNKVRSERFKNVRVS